LVVVAIIALLIAILMPALNSAREQSRIVVCASNQHQLATTFILYGVDFHGQVPLDKQSNNGNWLWDLTHRQTDDLIKRGAQREMFFCPSNPEQNADGLWNYNAAWRVTGYWFTLRRLVGSMVVPSGNFLTGKPYVDSLQMTRPADTELTTDATLSVNNVFDAIQGGFPTPHRTPHLDGVNQPVGGNISFLDGHAAWRPFSEMAIQKIDPFQWF
jgi:prepilin-type processing-associated H-X9-DG protein